MMLLFNLARRHAARAAAVPVLAALAAAIPASLPAVPAQAVARPHSGGHMRGPHLTRPRPRGERPQVITGPVTDHGGPVQTAPRVYVDFWDWTADPSGEQAYLTNFLSSVGGTSWLSAVSQYGGGSGAGLLAGTWSDPSAIPASPSDAQIQAEAVKAASHFGTGNSVNVQIVVATPTGHSTPGFGTEFCAYHGTVAADPNITYTDLPYMTDAGSACGEDLVNGASGTLDGVSIVEGHELAESITDPLLNAWYDAGHNEIADKCAWSGLTDIATTAGRFAVQPLWSNAANGCVVSSGVRQVAAESVARNSDGRLQVFAIGSDHAIWDDWQTCAGECEWSGWSTLGGSLDAMPAVIANADGRLEVFDIDATGMMWHDWQTTPGGTWSGWSNLGGRLVVSTPTVSRNANGELEIFATGTGGSVWTISQTSPGGGWSGWSSLGTPGTGVVSTHEVAMVAAGENADGRLEIFASTTNGTVWHDWQATPGGAWSGWSSLGSTITQSVSVARNSDGSLEIFALAPGGGVLTDSQTSAGGGWSGWSALAGTQTSAPPVPGQDQDGRLEIFALASAGALWHDWQTTPGGAWSGWSSFGGSLLSASIDTPAVGQNTDGRLEVFATAPDGSIWHNWQTGPNGVWSGWSSLG